MSENVGVDAVYSHLSGHATEDTKEHLGDTKFWHELMDGIYGTRQGDARIIIDAEDSAKGVGKTGLAVFLARVLARVFDYEFTEEDMTLSGAQYLKRVQEHPGKEQPSVIILDELAGAGAGHAYREMSNQNVELGNWWQLMRSQRTVTVTTLPHWSKASKSMRREAEFRLHCLKKPIGYFKAYEVVTAFDNGDIHTRRLDNERIAFPDMPGRGDPMYEALAEKKDRLLDSATTDADALADTEGAEADGGVDPDVRERVEDATKREEAVKTVIRACQPWSDDGLSYAKAAQLVDYSREWVGNRVREWRDEHKHRDLVEDPTAG